METKGLNGLASPPDSLEYLCYQVMGLYGHYKYLTVSSAEIDFGRHNLWSTDVRSVSHVKGLAQAKIIKSSVILFWLLNMTI